MSKKRTLEAATAVLVQGINGIDVHPADPVTARSIRQAVELVNAAGAAAALVNLDQPALEWDWSHGIAADVIDLAFFRCYELRRTMSTLCKRFRQLYFDKYMRKFSVPLIGLDSTRIRQQSFHPDTRVVVAVFTGHNRYEDDLCKFHELLISHGFTRIPTFWSQSGLPLWTEKVRREVTINYPVCLSEIIEIEINSQYLSVLTEIRGVKTLKLIIPGFTSSLRVGRFPAFRDLETLQFWHENPTNSHRGSYNFGNFFSIVMAIVHWLRPKTLAMTTALWRKHGLTPGKFGLPVGIKIETKD